MLKYFGFVVATFTCFQAFADPNLPPTTVSGWYSENLFVNSVRGAVVTEQSTYDGTTKKYLSNFAVEITFELAAGGCGWMRDVPVVGLLKEGTNATLMSAKDADLKLALG